jgi:RND family efflux transporter MFP subunit
MRLLLPLCLVAWLAASCQPGKPAATPAGAPNVTVAKPLSKKIIEWDEFAGRLESPKMVELRARVSGYLEKVHFKEGSEVNEGELLFTIDPRPYEAAVEGAKAELDRTRTRAELAKNEAKRAEGLIANRAIAAEDYDSRLKAAAEAQAAVRVAEASLKSASLDLEFTTVKAPIAGRISNAMITEGNLITGGNKDATLLTTIVALDPIYCYVEVDERSSLKYRELFKQGKRVSALYDRIPAEMKLSNEEGFPHKGEIDFVDNQMKPDTGTIRARGVFSNPGRLMAPGFFARLRIPGTGEYEALMVKDSAVGNDQGKSFVYVVNAESKAEYRPVEIGPLESGLRIVRSGLKADERIVTNGVMSVRAGIALTVTEEEMAPATSAAESTPANSAR